LYQYAVTAYDTSGNISAQNNAAATTLAATPVVTAPATTTPTSPTPLPIVSPAVPVVPIVTPTAPAIPIATSTRPIPPENPLPAPSLLVTNLYYGERNTQVTALQTFLIQNNDLGPNYATGFYGSLTQAAVKQFQCAKSIVCSGSPATTGWGSVGPRTRAAINAG
jgi:peptidoglycan hydrolase-like protein with peptidoglycan-binding domain